MVVINPTTFELILSTKFEVGDILKSYDETELLVHKTGDDHIMSYTKCLVQTMDDLEIEIRHFKFLYRNKLI